MPADGRSRVRQSTGEADSARGCGQRPRSQPSPIYRRAVEYLTLDQAAAVLGRTPQQVYVLIRTGELLAIKTGERGGWRVPRRNLEAYRDGRPQP